MTIFDCLKDDKYLKRCLRWCRVWLLWYGTLPFFYCFCLFVLCLVILLLSVLPETNYWTQGNTHRTFFFQVFDYSDTLLDVLVGGAAVLVKCSLRRKRGKRTGALVKLHERGFRTALPSVHLANLRSLPNKTDELLLTCTNKDFSNSAALCFTETWLSEAIPDNALHLPGYQLFRADRITELTGKTRGGGLCFYINEGWCSDVTTLKKLCSPNLEALFINCKHFYSPREFSSFILVNVYVPPDACVSAMMQQLAEQISEMEQRYPDSLLIILGDFNKANLSRELPKYRQHQGQ